MATNSNTKLKVWEHPKNSGIKIRERINNRRKDGSYRISFRVTIPTRLSGKSNNEPTQFKTKEEAFTFAQHQLNNFKNLGLKAQNLSTKQRLDAQEAFALLEPFNFNLQDIVRKYLELIEVSSERGLTVDECLHYAIDRIKPVGGSKSMNEVIDELIGIKEKDQLRPRSISDFRMRAKRIGKDIGDLSVTEINSDLIKDWLWGLNLSARSRKNYWAILSELFKFSIQRSYLIDNPLETISPTEIKALKGLNAQKEREPNILSVSEAQRLLKAAFETDSEIGMLPVVVLGLFCGIRTEELKRLEWIDIFLDVEEPFVSIPATKAKKRRIRNIPIPENAIVWLNRCERKQETITLDRYKGQYDRLFRRLMIAADFGSMEKVGNKENFNCSWQENNMRHSFASYHFALHGDSILTSRLLGHKSSDDVLFDHYRALTNKKDAERYFCL
jgi:integrase